MTRRLLAATPPLAALLLGLTDPRPTRPPTGGPNGPPAPASGPGFAWPGVYDLTGSGFPEGDREVVLTVTRRDTTHALDMAGPPGHLVAFRLAGDSAHVLWHFEDGGRTMAVDLCGGGDTLTGRWYSGGEAGPVTGRRRR